MWIDHLLLLLLLLVKLHLLLLWLLFGGGVGFVTHERGRRRGRRG